MKPAIFTSVLSIVFFYSDQFRDNAGTRKNKMTRAAQFRKEKLTKLVAF